ncbi:MAG TPA: glycosyltransferase family A protein [Alphaproteobacteria bacterium]|nr:glycosyltransferase family A protein [Alphaproteobacteria bacterium]
MNALPGVSAIMPVHNGAAHMADGLRSILAQKRPPDEIIVVDDGSTDGSGALAKQVAPLATVIDQPNQGPAQARNAGVAAARHEYIALLDHDDLWPPGRTERLLACAKANPAAGIVCGRTEMVAAGPGVTLDQRLLRASGTNIPFLFPSALIRRAVWIELGGMDPGRDHAEDTDLYLRIVEAGIPVAFIEATTLIYRHHGNNRSRAVEQSQAALMGSLRASLLRRRAARAEG